MSRSRPRSSTPARRRSASSPRARGRPRSPSRPPGCPAPVSRPSTRVAGWPPRWPGAGEPRRGAMISRCQRGPAPTRTVRPRTPAPPSNRPRRRDRPPNAPSRGPWRSVWRRSRWASSRWAGRCSPPGAAASDCQARAWDSIPEERALPDGWAVTATNFFVGNSTVTLEGPAADTETGEGVMYATVTCYGNDGSEALARSRAQMPPRQPDDGPRGDRRRGLRDRRRHRALGHALPPRGPGVVPRGRGQRDAGRAALHGDGVRPGDDRREGRGPALGRRCRHAGFRCRNARSNRPRCRPKHRSDPRARTHRRPRPSWRGCCRRRSRGTPFIVQSFTGADAFGNDVGSRAVTAGLRRSASPRQISSSPRRTTRMSPSTCTCSRSGSPAPIPRRSARSCSTAGWLPTPKA